MNSENEDFPSKSQAFYQRFRLAQTHRTSKFSLLPPRQKRSVWIFNANQWNELIESNDRLNARDTNYIVVAGVVDNIFDPDFIAKIADIKAKSIEFTDKNKNSLTLYPQMEMRKLEAVVRMGGIAHVFLSVFPSNYKQYRIAVETMPEEDITTVEAKWKEAKDIFLTCRKTPDADRDVEGRLNKIANVHFYTGY